MSENGDRESMEKSLKERVEELKDEIMAFQEVSGIKRENIELLSRIIFENYYEEIKKSGCSAFEGIDEETIVRELRQLQIPIVVHDTTSSEDECYSSLLDLLKDMFSTIPRDK